MGLFEQEDLEEQWATLKENEETLREIHDSGEKQYDLGPTSENVTLGDYLDRSIPEEVRELQGEGLVTMYLESREDGNVATAKASSIGEGLLDMDSLEEAKNWYRELEEWAEEEYGRK